MLSVAGMNSTHPQQIQNKDLPLCLSLLPQQQGFCCRTMTGTLPVDSIVPRGYRKSPRLGKWSFSAKDILLAQYPNSFHNLENCRIRWNILRKDGRTNADISGERQSHYCLERNSEIAHERRIGNAEVEGIIMFLWEEKGVGTHLGNTDCSLSIKGKHAIEFQMLSFHKTDVALPCGIQ